MARNLEYNGIRYVIEYKADDAWPYIIPSRLETIWEVGGLRVAYVIHENGYLYNVDDPEEAHYRDVKVNIFDNDT